MTTSTPPLWSPAAAQIRHTRLRQFLDALHRADVLPLDVDDMHALQRWSVEHLEAFWAAVWQAADIAADGPGPADAPWNEVLHGAERMAPPDPILGPTWFTETRLNFAERLLHRRDDHLAGFWNARRP